MAEEETNCVAQVYDLISILVSSGTHFVVRGNGDQTWLKWKICQVKVDSLKGKKVALYFSAKHCSFLDICEQELAEAYNEILPTNDFEVLCISGYEDRESFDEYLAKMPWLAVPFSDYEKRDHLHELFGVVGGKHSLFIIDENGKVLTKNGFHIIGDYGAEGYPFSPERIKYLEEYLKDHEEATKRNQTLKSILAFVGRDYVLAADGNKVPVSELVGKTVCLYFPSSDCPDECPAFTRHLVRVYEKLREKGHNFEIVMIPDNIDYEPYNLPWNYIPYKRRNYFRLYSYCDAVDCPFLFIIGPDGTTLNGKTINSRVDMEDKISKYGSQAFPFTRERFLELEDMEKAKQEAQTLESVLTLGEEDFLIGKSGAKVSELRGYNILLYFDDDNCTQCCGSLLEGDNSCRKVNALLPKLIETYNAIKAKDDVFEVIFISSDKDQSSFDEFFSKMPWLAIPFGDERLQCLRRRYGLIMLFCLPVLVAMDPTGKTIGYPEDSIMAHGADAYPFNNQRRKELGMEEVLLHL